MVSEKPGHKQAHCALQCNILRLQYGVWLRTGESKISTVYGSSTLHGLYNYLHLYEPNTRLPSNVRLTTRKCEHLVTVMRGHLRSCDKDDDHTIRSAIAENPMIHANFMVLL